MKLNKLWVKTIVLLTFSIVIFLLGLNEALVLHYYSNGVYIIISITLRWISSLFSFSFGDFLYVGIGIYLIVLLTRFLNRALKKSAIASEWKRPTIQLINILLILYISFKLVWGLNYSRPSISKTLNIDDKKYSVEELVQLGNFFIDRLNALELKVNNQKVYSFSMLRDQAVLDYRHAAKNNPFFNYARPSIKPVLNSWVVSKIGIEGYYNPLSGEANVNQNLMPWVLPFVTCHEMAHQIGVAREDEANLVAYLVGINSSDINFQYSVNYTMLRYILFEIRFKSPDDYQTMRNRINTKIIALFKVENNSWRKYNGQMSNYMGMAFDKFLKLNNQKRGLKSYQNIVIWLYNYHKHEFNN